MDDARALNAEPLSLDLANTVWIDGGRARDLLAEPAGERLWLAAAGHSDAPAGPAARDALTAARDAIHAVVERRGDVDALNAVLARGHLVARLGTDGPERTLEVADEHWRVPWLAAHDLLALLRVGPDRIRRCANPDCGLHFFDVSRAGKRQWCSMASCGNRAKARRHYERIRARAADQ